MLCVCDGAETFACECYSEAHGHQPGPGMPVSFIGTVQRWVQGSTMVSGARKIEMRALPSRAGDFDRQDVAKLKEHDDYAAEDTHSDHP